MIVWMCAVLNDVVEFYVKQMLLFVIGMRISHGTFDRTWQIIKKVHMESIGV